MGIEHAPGKRVSALAAQLADRWSLDDSTLEFFAVHPGNVAAVVASQFVVPSREAAGELGRLLEYNHRLTDDDAVLIAIGRPKGERLEVNLPNTCHRLLSLHNNSHY